MKTAQELNDLLATNPSTKLHTDITEGLEYLRRCEIPHDIGYQVILSS